MCGVGVYYAKECASAMDVVGGSDSYGAVYGGSYESDASDGGVVGGVVCGCSDECGSYVCGNSVDSDSSSTGE